VVEQRLKWWKDLVSLAKGEEVDWFREEIVREVWGMGKLLVFGRSRGEGRSLLWLNSIDFFQFLIIKRRRFKKCGLLTQVRGGGILVGGANCLYGRIIF